MSDTIEPRAPVDEAPHLLVVDDDSRIRTLISRFLVENGFRVTAAQSAEEARKKMGIIAFDLLIVDVMMPGENGMDFTAAVRAASSVPILMLTARSETENRIRGLELGADDYLAKPFDPRELLLRLNNILKRGAPAVRVRAKDLRFGPFVWDGERDELRRGDEVVRLTDGELRLMRMFAERPGETIPRHEIVQGESALGDRTADVQINRLRRKIEADPANPLHLVTVRGQGYRLKTDQAAP
ncbi:response regulator [Pinisolibacter aquiterrae]|uniref:response regulator n=1 Tax=Pinisolibacter aquiterrae TaxID=2815579 RepID=UPI001C3C6548|nr:response regulator transcription factor [Pinisolibacter aquiterrae]MBV5263354.1 response regulator transcription factor [Pinisolibacter aquiterrae]MCC8237568.1 response regulator transcription factor [Pinisolibacter aquiterrae]